MARTDIHRPSAINPTEYNFVACDYYGGSAFEVMYVKEDREIFRAHMQKSGGKMAQVEHEGFGTCDICGARALYVAKFHHTPTNTYIVTGMDCAAKVDIAEPIHFRSFKKRVAAGLEASKGKAKAMRILTEAGLVAAWEAYKAGDAQKREKGWDSLGRAEQILDDVVYKVVRYGNISDGQKGLLAKLLVQIAERPAIEAARAAELANVPPVPVTDKRVSVKGKVLTTRTDEGPYGSTVKMLVQTEAGYKLWGTAPSALLGCGVLKGSTVEFCAKIQRSEKDEKFGFFSRPTKANIVEPAPTQEGAA